MFHLLDVHWLVLFFGVRVRHLELSIIVIAALQAVYFQVIGLTWLSLLMFLYVLLDECLHAVVIAGVNDHFVNASHILLSVVVDLQLAR